MKWRTDSLVPTQAQAVMNAWEKEIVAIHESGHAIMDKSVEHADPVQESVEKLGGDAKVKAEQELAALRRKPQL